MKSFKKAVLSLVLITSFVSPSKAALGVSFAAPIAVVAGVAAMAVSGGAAYGGYRLIKRGGTGSTIAGIAALALSAGGAYFGLLLLDGEQSAEFSELSASQASALKVSADDIAIYNSEVEQVNAIAREIGEVLTKNGKDNVELSTELWMDLGTNLSPETMKVVIAVASQK